ncbi:transcription termination/antitermination NusG family protein [Kiritimatiellaeota bacterium B1221]|nr:transcription termination/antitermination NusG family protein [Kiritimatiellaeota bacterium B1221]
MSDQPPSIPDFLHPSPEGWQWVVFHSKPRCEKKVENLQRLRPAKIFLPCIERIHNYGARKRVNHIPMFTGYVFGMIQKEDRRWFMQNPNVANILDVVDETQFLVPLKAIAEALQNGMNLEVFPDFSPGRKVQITGGPMKGLEAEVTEIKGKTTVLLRLDMIQQTVAMEIDMAYLKLLS